MARKKTPNSGMGKFQERQRLNNLVASAELDEAEILIAIERYKQHKQQVEEAKTSYPNSTVITVLPGTNFDNSPDVQLTLVKRATELGITGGQYEDWELVQFGDHIVSLRDEWHLENIMQLLKYVDIGGKLLRELDKVAILVRNTTGNLWAEAKDSGGQRRTFPFSEVEAGLISDYWVQLGILAEGLYIDPATIPPVDKFVNGIRRLVNEKDRGQLLREAVAEYDPSAFEDIQPYLDMLPKTGAPTSSEIDRLCIRAKPYIEQSYTYAETFNQMVRDLDKPTLNRLEQQEAKKLDTWTVESFEKAYRLRWGKGKQVTSVHA